MKAVCEAIRPSLETAATGGVDRSRHHLREHDRVARRAADCALHAEHPGAAASGRQRFAYQRRTAEQRQQAEELLSAVGIALWLDEEQQLDAVTRCPRFARRIFLLIEALTAAGVKPLAKRNRRTTDPKWRSAAHGGIQRC